MNLPDVMKIQSLLICLSLFASCTNNNSEKKNPEFITNTTPTINYIVTGSLAHDTNAFTEGLLVHKGELYESTGSPKEMPQTKSIVGPVNSKTGIIDKKIELDRNKYFGEGIVFLNKKIYQLTYQTQKGFIYDIESFKKTGEFTYASKEGWGLTTDGSSLIMSDGTNIITYLNPQSFRVEKTISVANENGPVKNLNELEFINGFIYANVFNTSAIIKIDPETGQVIGKLDLSSLAKEAKLKYPPSLEMNGIAYDSTSKKIFVTGKMWPTIYEIQFDH